MVHSISLNTIMTTILENFPLALPPRKGQKQAIELIQQFVGDDVRDIVIEAPTGAGKSAIGAAVCMWAGTLPVLIAGSEEFKSGGYYLVTQKSLQDQITDDVRKNFRIKDFASLKAAEAYTCEEHGNCQVGLMVDKSKACECRKLGCCRYTVAKKAFEQAKFSLTNYAYFMTEKMMVGKLPARQVMVLDECHTIERTLLKFGELVLTSALLKDWGLTPPLRIPEYDDMGLFLKWVEKMYAPMVADRLDVLKKYVELNPLGSDKNGVRSKITALQSQLLRAKVALSGATSKPDDWVYWCDETEEDGIIVNLKPLRSAPYAPILKKGAKYRIYMSAYPGDQDLFCESMGINPEEVAWIRLPSSFPVENRPIVMSTVGSMSKRNIENTFPSFVRVVDKILSQHSSEKGIIHCNSYALGDKIFRHFAATPHASRLLFPRNAEERESAKDTHEKLLDSPTVLISPSMTEGFDFRDDLARWQIIAKVPYPYLGDLQVARKKELDPAWYSQQAASTIIQACGRIVRCVDLETEILTDTGWKTYRDLRPGDISYGISPRVFRNSGRPLRFSRVPVEPNIVTQVNRFPAAPTFRIKAKGIDSVVSEDHNVPYQPVTIKKNGKYRHKLVSAGLKMAKTRDLPTRFKLPLSGYIGGRLGRKRTKLSNDWFWLMGFVIADGYISPSKNLVIITQSSHKSKQVEKLVQVLKRLNLTFTRGKHHDAGSPMTVDGEHLYYRNGVGYYWQFTGCNSARIRDVFFNGMRRRYSKNKLYRQRTHSGVDGWKDVIKTVPRWCLQRASASQLLALLDGLMAGDGTWCSKKSGCFFSKDESLVDLVQELAALVGFRSHKRSRRGQYELQISRVGTVDISKCNVRRGGTKELWCPTTELGTFIARRNGHTFITGNSESDHGVTYVLDSDIKMLWERYGGRFFPGWFSKAIVWT